VSAEPRFRIARFPATAGSNPYLRLLDQELSARGFELVAEPQLSLGRLWRQRQRQTFLHFHWELARHSASIPALARFAARLATARLLGYRIVWTIHNVEPAQVAAADRLRRVARKLLARSSHLLMAHDESTIDAVRAELGRQAARIRLVPHPSYRGVYPAGRDRETVRAELHIPRDAFTFLCFGRLRDDKGIELLLEAYRELGEPDAVLVVAGEVHQRQIGASVLDAFRADPRLRPLLQVVPVARVAELFGAADAAVFPRSESRTSGSLILALSLGLPAVAAQLEPYSTLLGHGRAGWLFRPGDAGSLRAALEAAVSEPALEAKAVAARAVADALPTWSETGEQTAALMLRAAGVR
jgi:beta-1,4-mannosyltransferase